MLGWIASHLRHNAVAYLALFVALSSTSVAAVTLARNSVLSRHIKDGQVKRPDIANKAVTSAKVKANSLTGCQINESTLAGVNAATLGGLGSSAFASAGHNHDPTYVNEGQADSVSAGMISNPTRAISLPLTSFVDCDSDAGAHLDFVSGADRIPDFVNSPTDGQGFSIVFDTASGNEDQNSEICSQLAVPPDYVGGGTVVIRAEQAASTGDEELLSCGGTHNGTGPGAPVRVQTAAGNASYACTPQVPNAPGPPVPGSQIGLFLSIGSSATINDPVTVHAVEWTYTAAQ
jgi:hypothetical protein